MNYSIPEGVSAIPNNLLDLRSDAEIDHDLLNPKPVSGEKNVWFFWHSGFEKMQPYTRRNVRAWHRRLSRLDWTIRVLDRQPSSPLNIANFLDTEDPEIFPRAFRDGAIGGDYAPQHTSDLVRWPLLLKYGGVYADVGLMQIGNLDRLWNQTVGDSASPFEVLSYNASGARDYSLTNYFLASGPVNPLFARAHRLLLELWAADGGKESTEGMHSDPLVKQIPLMMRDNNLSFLENGRTYGPEEVSKMLTDYIIQSQVLTLVMGLVDEEDGWDGPQYVADHVWATDYMVGSQLINEFTTWNGQRAFDLMSLPLPKEGEPESEDQGEAREIVEACLKRSFGFKLATGLILRVFSPTLSSLWRQNVGSDDVQGSYAHWLRHATIYWSQDELPPRLEFEVIEPFKRGPLLRDR